MSRVAVALLMLLMAAGCQKSSSTAPSQAETPSPTSTTPPSTIPQTGPGKEATAFLDRVTKLEDINLSASLRQLSSTQAASSNEVLGALSDASEDVRFQVLSALVMTQSGAEWFCRNSPVAVHVCVGLDTSFRAKVTEQLIAPGVEAPHESADIRLALILLATELRVLEQFPGQAASGLETAFQLAENTDRDPQLWQVFTRSVGAWIEALSPDAIVDRLRSFESRAQSNPLIASLWRSSAEAIALGLIEDQPPFQGPEGATLLRVLAGKSEGEGDPQMVPGATDAVLDVLYDQPDPGLQSRFLQMLSRMPARLSEPQVKRVFEMAGPDFHGKGPSFHGPELILKNISPKAVPWVMSEMIKWWRISLTQENDGAIRSLRFMLETVAQQADSATAKLALETFEAASDDIDQRAFGVYRFLVAKLPREDAQVYLKTYREERSPDASRQILIGLAESDHALDSAQRRQLIERLADDPGLIRQVGFPVAALCNHLTVEDREAALQSLSSALSAERISRSLPCWDSTWTIMEKDGLLMTSVDAERVSRVLVQAARRDSQLNSARLVERMESFVAARPESERVQLINVAIQAIPNSSNVTPVVVFIRNSLQTLESSELPALLRLALQEMQQCDEQDSGKLVRISMIADAICAELPPEHRMEFATVLPDVASEASSRLMLRLLGCLSELSSSLSPASAEELLDRFLRDADAAEDRLDGIRRSCICNLPQLAARVPPEAVPDLQRRLQEYAEKLADDRREADALQLRIVELCTMETLSTDEFAELLQIIADARSRDGRAILRTLASASPVLRNKTDSQQQQQLFAATAAKVAEGLAWADSRTGRMLLQLVQSADRSSTASMLQTFSPIFQACRDPSSRATLTPALDEMWTRLDADDLPTVTGLIASGSQFKNNKPVYDRRALGAWFTSLTENSPPECLTLLKLDEHAATLASSRWYIPEGLHAEFGGLTGSESRMADFVQSLRDMQLGEPSVQQIVVALKDPHCVGRTQQSLLQELSKRAGRVYSSVWEVVGDQDTLGLLPEDLLRSSRGP